MLIKHQHVVRGGLLNNFIEKKFKIMKGHFTRPFFKSHSSDKSIERKLVMHPLVLITWEIIDEIHDKVKKMGQKVN
jgi:hypothetical protein